MDSRIPTHGTKAQQQDRTMVALANAAYDPAIREPVPGWRSLERDERRAMGVGSRHLRDERSGFRANVYTNDRGGYVVAMAGTDTSELADHVTNLRQVAGLATTQYDQARTLTARVVDAVGRENVAVTGHSLGGSLATAAALHSGTQAVVFNAAPLHNNQLPHRGADRAAGIAGQVRHYEMPGEFLGRLRRDPSRNWGLPGVRMTLTSSHGRVDSSSALAPLLLHSLDAVASSMGRNEMFHGDNTRSERYYAANVRHTDPAEDARIRRAVDISSSAYQRANTPEEIRRARGTDLRLAGEVSRNEEPQRQGGYLDRESMRSRQTANAPSPFARTMTSTETTVTRTTAEDRRPASAFKRSSDKGKEPQR